ncbi:MAG: arylsulfatase [Phycisphaerae bacterium]|nr:arylsulfatase [Phycisphaerae bacterium]
MAPAAVLSTSRRTSGAEGKGAGRPPNIIFILADDLGYGDLGCYGQKQIQTPNLDRFAAEGVRFTQAYAGSTVCAPSRCCLMTGRDTGHARIRGNARVPLLPKDVTVAEVLKQAGYATGIVGKWGLGEAETTGIPTRQGFDEWFGYLNQRNAHNHYPHFLWRNEKKVLLKGNLGSGEAGKPYDEYGLEAAKLQTGPDGKRREYSQDLFTAEALDFVARHHRGPFFLYLAYTIPHANNEGGRATGNGMEVPDYGPYADKPWRDPQKGHAAMITRMDRDIGRLMAKLRELGIDKDTIVFFSSDNGPHREGGALPDFFDSNGAVKGIKRDLYEGGIRVPTMARWPGKIKAGTVSDQAWAFWDFLPTAAELAGVKPPAGIEGLSIVPTLVGTPGQRQHEYLYWEFHEGASKQAVRMGDWKAVRLGPGKPLELYDLKTDIGEEHDVAREHPDVVAKIEGILKGARTESEPWPIRDGGAAIRKKAVKKKTTKKKP